MGLPTYLSGHLLVYPIVGYGWVVCSSAFSFSLLPLDGKYYRLEIGILKGWGENMKIAKKKRKKEPVMTAHTNTEASELAKHCIKALAMGCSHVLIEMCHCLLNGIDMKEKKPLPLSARAIVKWKETRLNLQNKVTLDVLMRRP